MTRHARGLIDTNTIITLELLDPDHALPMWPLVSAISLAELSVGPLLANDADRMARLAHLQRAEADFEVLPFDADCARAFGRVAASLRRKGRKTTARTFDAMIAAVALAHGLPLYTANPRDFEGIDGLEVIPVEVPR